MAVLKIFSLNVRGLNDVSKQDSLLEFIKSYDTDVVCLQETFLLYPQAKKMYRSWIGQLFSTNYSSFCCGVMILIKKGVPLTIQSSRIDTEGRYIILRGLWANQDFTIVNSYAPNKNVIPFFSQITNLIATSSAKVLWTGDFNLPFNLDHDRASKALFYRIKEQSFFSNMVEQLNLIDAWRTTNPTTKEYSYFSLKYNMASRLDYIFLSAELRSSIKTCTMGSQIFSDHASLMLHLVPSPFKPTFFKWRFPAGFLLDKHNGDLLVEQTSFFFSENLPNETSAASRWEAWKATIRGWTMAQVKINKSKEVVVIRELERQIKQNELSIFKTLLEQRPIQTLVREGKILQGELKQAFRTKILKARFHANRLHFLEGEQSPRLLAWRLRKESSQNIIRSITRADGVVTSDLVEINKAFEVFYHNLYLSKMGNSIELLQSCIDRASLPQISPAEALVLSEDISIAELYRAIDALPHYKAPGPDGIPGEIYQLCRESIVAPLLRMFLEAYQLERLPPTLQQADLILLLKKDKDPLLCESYRPIALINLDAKILAKVLAGRLESLLPNLIHIDQAGFVSKRGVSDNLLKVVRIIYGRELSEPGEALCLFDISKAFDSMEWSFLWSALQAYGLGESFIRWVKLLYQSPSNRVCTNAEVSPFFLLERGTRQGCPLSPMLFILAMEVLAGMLRNHDELQGITINSVEQRLLLFADDLLVCISNPEISVPVIFTILQQFAIVSGLTVNSQKTELISLNASYKTWDTWFNEQNIRPEFKYLGIIFSMDPQRLIDLNYEPVISKIEQNLQLWTRLPLSLQARINTIKMMCLSSIMFIFMNLPVIPNMKIFRRLEMAMHKFIWSGKPARIGRETLYLHRYQGGMALPNFQSYWLAAQVDWLRRLMKLTVSVGNTTCRELLYGGQFGVVQANYLANYIGQLGSRAMGFPLKKGGQNQMSSWTPVSRIVDIPGDWVKWAGQAWPGSKILTIESIMELGKLLELDALYQLYDFPSSGTAVFRYHQLRSTCSRFNRQGISVVEPNVREVFLFSSEGWFSAESIVARFYRKINPTSTSALRNIWLKWDKDVEELTTVEEQERLWCEVLPGFKSIFHRLILFKTIHQFYLTPSKLHQWDKNRSSSCPRCNYAIGDLIHMLWRCPKLFRYWTQISQIVGNIFGMEIVMTPKMVVLQIFPQDLALTKGQGTFLHIVWVVAKKVILINWKQSNSPTIHEWLMEMIKLSSYFLESPKIVRCKKSEEDQWIKFKATIGDQDWMEQLMRGPM